MTSIDSLMVAPTRRRRGIGKALVDAATNVARQQGATRMDLYSRIDRTEARRCYEALGFEVVSIYFIRNLGS